jgi:hypothetical protein
MLAPGRTATNAARGGTGSVCADAGVSTKDESLAAKGMMYGRQAFGEPSLFLPQGLYMGDRRTAQPF